MIVVHDPANASNLITLFIEDDAWSVKHSYNGFDTLSLQVDSKSEYVKYLKEEVKLTVIGLRGQDNEFLIKNVDDRSGILYIDADINLDEWKATIIPSYRKVNSSLDDILTSILPNGWSKSGQEKFTKRTTIEANEGKPLEAVTPLEILDKCPEAYGCVFNFDTLAKVVKCIDPSEYKASGEFVMKDLNMSDLGFTGSSSGFATRLYAYGKQDEDTGEYLTFASINDGKPYVEDISYCDKIVCVGWNDERYTVKEDLLAASKAKLAELSKPTRSYECSDVRLTSNTYLYQIVTLIDSDRKIRVDHQVIEWIEGGNRNNDSVTLSAVVPSIASLVKEKIDVDSKIDQATKDLTSAYNKAIEEATEKIKGSYGGYFKWVYDVNGNPMELVNLGDSTDIDKAQHVWRWNKEGLAHSNTGYNGTYDLALMADGSINASMMTVGIIQGGNSYWNLNTGELHANGYFRTSSVRDYVQIDPEFSQYENEGTDKMKGAGIEFVCSENYMKSYIASETFTEEEGKVSALTFHGGYVKKGDPGAWMRIGERKQYDNDTKFGGLIRSFCYSEYEKSSNSESYAGFYANAPEVSANDATNVGMEAVKNIGTDNYVVGIDANVDNKFLSFSGFVGTFNKLGTFPAVNWTSAQTITPFYTSTFSATLPSPPKYGTYRPQATVDHVMSDGNKLICSVANCGPSGWNAYVCSFPKKVVTSVDANWSHTGDGTVKNLSINVNTATLFPSNSTTFLLFTLGVLLPS